MVVEKEEDKGRAFLAVGYRMSLIDRNQDIGGDSQGLASDSGVRPSHEARVELESQEPDL